MRIVDLHCDHCAATRRFEQPSCRDRHDADCAEWTCVACGNAMLIAPYTIMLERPRPVLLRRAA